MPRRFNWQPSNFEPMQGKTDPHDNFDARLPRGDVYITRESKAAPTFQPAPKPVFCADCGGREFWQLSGGRWMCSKCKPQPAAPARPSSPEPQPTAQAFPQYVNFYALMGIEAARRNSGMGGGFRAWVMGKALDTQGRGMVARETLKAFALALGINPRTWKRWLTEARNNDMLTDVQTKGGEWMFILHGPATVAAGMKLETVGRKVEMKTADLIGAGWKARIWGGYLATHNGKPITREKMQKIVNVAASTQRYRDARAHVTRTRNLIKSQIKAKADQVRGLKEHEIYNNRKGIFVYRDGFLGWHGPNTYTVSFATRGGKGRGRKVARAIRTILATRNNNGLSIMRRALSDDSSAEVVRLFNRTESQTRAALRKLSKQDGRRIKDLYQFALFARSGAGIWNHCPVVNVKND